MSAAWMKAAPLVARQLIAIAPKLAQAIPGLRMLIVGGGDVFEELLEESRKTNAQIGRECITMTGGRTDINELVAVADVFVGVSPCGSGGNGGRKACDRCGE